MYFYKGLYELLYGPATSVRYIRKHVISKYVITRLFCIADIFTPYRPFFTFQDKYLSSKTYLFASFWDKGIKNYHSLTSRSSFWIKSLQCANVLFLSWGFSWEYQNKNTTMKPSLIKVQRGFHSDYELAKFFLSSCLRRLDSWKRALL